MGELIGFGVSALLTGAVGIAGAWIVLGLLVVVGLLLYFNMTIGDLVAALPRRARRAPRARGRGGDAGRRPPARGAAARGAATEPAAADARPGLIDRMRDRLAGGTGEMEDEPPVIVRRERPAPGATNGAARPSRSRS